MKTARVQLYGFTGKYVVVNTEATAGATVGSDLRWPDGSIVTEVQLRYAAGAANSSPSLDGTTDEIVEGQYNFYFSDRRAQDAIGGIVENSADIDLTYDSATPSITAYLTDTGVAAGSYGGGVKIIMLTVDSKGRITASSEQSLIAGNGISFDADPDTGAVTISVNSFVADNRVTEAGDTRITPSGDIRITR